jgi:hypothetical protein
MTDDRAAMEASLVAAAGAEAAMRARVFERFFAAYPAHEAAFLHVEVTSVRMLDETLQTLLGAAEDASWVWPHIADLVYEHRGYGNPGASEYAAFIDIAVDELGRAAGDAWTPACEQAWRDAAATLKAMIGRASTEWAASQLA